MGDLGRIDDEGLLWFTGRKRDIIKSGGINVYAPEIEEALSGHRRLPRRIASACPIRTGPRRSAQ